MANTKKLNRSFVISSKPMSSERNTELDRLVDRGIRPQNTSCTYTGVPLNTRGTPRRPHEHRVRGEPHYCEQNTEGDRNDHGIDGQLQGLPEAVQHANVEEVFDDQIPRIHGPIGECVVDEQADNDDEHGSDHRAPWVAQLIASMAWGSSCLRGCGTSSPQPRFYVIHDRSIRLDYLPALIVAW